MIILGVDSSTPILALALMRGRTTLAHCNCNGAMQHSKNMLPCIDRMLRKAEIPWTKISGIVLGCGPGSYTGLRIGFAGVRGLAAGRNIPVAVFSSLALIAQNMKPTHTNIAVILDARREKFYCALFTRKKGIIQRLTPDAVLSCAEIQELLDAHPRCAITGDALARFRDVFAADVPSASYLYGKRLWYPRAESIAGMIAAQRKNQFVPADTVVPAYMRVSEAEEKAAQHTGD